MNITWFDHDRGTSVYQSRSYGEAVCATSGGEWDAIGDEAGRWRIPLCIAQIDGNEYYDAASPYGYAGIATDPGLTGEEVSKAWETTLKILEARKVVSVFFRFAPYREGVETRHSLAGLELAELSRTVLITLGDEAEMWNAMQGRSRTAVRKAERLGYTARVIVERPLHLPAGEGFRRVYDIAMERVGASPIHLHGDDYYNKLANAGDVEMVLVETLDRDESVVASTLLLIDEEGVHYHLSGSIMDAAKDGANNLMIWTAMCWAAEQGYKRLHLGGGTSKDDGLFRFKASFGGVSLPFHVGKLIVNHGTYEHLLRKRAKVLGKPVEEMRQSWYFPAYRAAS